jgi:hypothetical protein
MPNQHRIIDYIVSKDTEICVVCGKEIHEWEHIETYYGVNSHKECSKVFKNKRKVKLKSRGVRTL